MNVYWEPLLIAVCLSHYFLFPIIVLYRQPLWNKYFSFSIFEILEEEVGY